MILNGYRDKTNDCIIKPLNSEFHVQAYQLVKLGLLIGYLSQCNTLCLHNIVGPPSAAPTGSGQPTTQPPGGNTRELKCIDKLLKVQTYLNSTLISPTLSGLNLTAFNSSQGDWVLFTCNSTKFRTANYTSRHVASLVHCRNVTNNGNVVSVPATELNATKNRRRSVQLYGRCNLPRIFTTRVPNNRCIITALSNIKSAHINSEYTCSYTLHD